MSHPRPRQTAVSQIRLSLAHSPSFSGEASLTAPIEDKDRSYVDDAAKMAFLEWLCFNIELVRQMGGFHRPIIEHTHDPKFSKTKIIVTKRSPVKSLKMNQYSSQALRKISCLLFQYSKQQKTVSVITKSREAPGTMAVILFHHDIL